MILKEKKTVLKEVPIIHVDGLDEFVKEAAALRKLPNMESLLLKVGMDKGQQMLKICLSIIHLLAEEDPNKKAFEQRFKDSGVKKIFIVAVTPGDETYENLLQLLQLAGFETTQLDLRFAADYKCINLLCGIGSASSTYPCPFCLWDHKAGDDCPSSEGWEHRTFQMIVDQFEAWKDSGGKDRDNKHFFNCKNRPLPVFRNPDTLVQDVFCLPVMHILQGVVNTMFKAIEAFFPGIVAWPKLLHVQRKEHHGKVFEVATVPNLLNFFYLFFVGFSLAFSVHPF